MIKVVDRDTPTSIHDSWDDFQPLADSSYIYGVSGEPRSYHSPTWLANQPKVQFVEVTEQAALEMSVAWAGSARTVPLRGRDALASLLADLTGSLLYLDVTGLSHHIWAPLMLACHNAKRHLRVVYAEPADYAFSTSPEVQGFDLSERIEGIRPIPGFISLRDVPEEMVCFVPLLGFEGGRLQNAIDQVNPPGRKIFPVVGVPGFRAEYPFFTYFGNEQSLIRYDAWPQVKFATANCPFGLYQLLLRLSDDYPDDVIKVALIGTKPHAVGAVLFKLVSGRRVELVHDYPKPRPNRSNGTGKVLVYDVSSLWI